VAIKVKCNQCGAAFGVPEKYAGKRIKCPKCKQSTIEIPADEQSAAKPAVSQPAPAQKAPAQKAPAQKAPAQKMPTQKAPSQQGEQQWYLQADETGETEPYGPVSKEEMDNWAAEGRLDGTCQVLKEGWEQWKWAEEIYPELGTSHAEQTPTAEAPAAAANPFAGIGDSQASGAGVYSVAEENAFVAPQVGGEAAAATGSPTGDGQFSPKIFRVLAETRPWVFFMSILGFIGAGLGAVISLIYGAIAMFTMSQIGAFGIIFFIGALFMAGIAVLYFFAAYYLFKYASQIALFLRTKASLELERGLTAQKSFWKLIAIVTIVVIILYILLFVFAFALG